MPELWLIRHGETALERVLATAKELLRAR